MPSLRDIRRRIRSIKNTSQITKAMEMVAASRMRRAQQRVTSARPYSETMLSLIEELAASVGSNAGAELHPLLVQRPIDTGGIVLSVPPSICFVHFVALALWARRSVTV